MAVLEQMVTPEVVRAARGVVDYYCWKGLIVARKWPRWSNYEMSPAQVRAQQNFGYVSKWTKGVSPAVADVFQVFTEGAVGYTWVDAFRAFATGNAWLDE